MNSFVTVSRGTFWLAASLLIAACDGGDGSDGNGNQDTGGNSGSEADKVWINEVMAANTTTLQDEVGSYPDWIELFNPNDREVDIGGWWLTDDVSNKFKWQIPVGVVIPASGFLVIYADSDTEEGDLHASFNLKAEGGDDVALFGPNVLDNPEIDKVEDMSLAVPDVSIARIPDGGPTWEVEAEPTPGGSNG